MVSSIPAPDAPRRPPVDPLSTAAVSSSDPTPSDAFGGDPFAASSGQCDGEDRISELPDDILISILCFLPLKEALLASAVSSRWKNLWKYTLRLNFDADSVMHIISMTPTFEKKERGYVERCKYVQWVNQVIQSHKALTLKEFRICFWLDQSFAKSITKWLEFAFSRQVERLELDISYNGDARSFFLPRCVLSEEQLLTQNKFIAGDTLKALSLKGVNVTDEVVDLFLRNCPSLEHLVIHDSSKLINLEVCGPSLSLKHLEIVYCTDLKSIKVSAPNLSSLAIPLPRPQVSVLLENVPSLVQIDVAFMYPPSLNHLVPVFWPSIFSQLEVLTLSSICTYFWELPDILKFPQLKRFEIECSSLAVYDYHRPHVLTSCIRLCPHLQEFVVKFHTLVGSPCDNQEFDEIDTPQFCHQHLKVFKFIGDIRGLSYVELVRFILVNCVALEKIVIDPHIQFPAHPRARRACRGSRPESVNEKIARNNTNKLIQSKVVPHHIQLLIIPSPWLV